MGRLIGIRVLPPDPQEARWKAKNGVDFDFRNLIDAVCPEPGQLERICFRTAVE